MNVLAAVTWVSVNVIQSQTVLENVCLYQTVILPLCMVLEIKHHINHTFVIVCVCAQLLRFCILLG